MTPNEIIPMVVQSTTEVLEQMAFLDMEPQPPQELEHWQLDNEVAASILFKGEYSGCMVICCSETFSREVTSNFLGLDDEALEPAHIIDNIKEMANIILGNLLCLIDDQKSLAKLEIPEYFKPGDQPASLPKPEIVYLIPFSFSSLNSENDEDTFYIELYICHTPNT